MLAEAEADEVHLVLSSVNSVENLKKTAQQFAAVGVTSLVLTKLDEATGLGNLIPLAAQLPAAAELRDERPERAGRHRAGRSPSTDSHHAEPAAATVTAGLDRTAIR